MTISGTSGDDNLTGTSGDDTFNLRQGGNDTVNGSGGDDVFIFGGTFTAADTVDGGSGSDLLRLDGDYTGANAVTLGAGTITGVETIQLSSGNSFTLTTNDANVAAGKTLYINGTALLAGNDLTFDGSAETDGNFRISGGLGDDSITLGAGLTVSDRVNGGGGNDTLNLNGAYNITLSRTTIGNIANLTLGGQHSYHIVTNDGTVAAGATMAVNAASLGASDTLNFNAVHELDGSFNITAGAGLTEIVSGRGNDSFHLGANLTADDRINGGLGNDSVYLGGADYNLTLSKSTLAGIENLHLAGGFDYHLTSAGRIDANATLAVDANSLTSSDVLFLDFSKETAGSVIFDVSSAQATLIGGSQGDAFDFSVSSQGGLVAGDRLDGGAGYDHLYFDGDYTGSHALTMNATTAANIEEFDFNAGHSYNVTIAAATVAAGATLKIDASAVDAANGVTFNGSAAGATSTLQFLGGAGNDALTGGSANDSFDLSQGGSDTATGGAGNNIFTMGAALDGGDSINGGAGNDTVSLNGDYSAGVTLGAATLTGVETLSFAAGHNYNITTNDGNVTSGLTLAVNSSALSSGNALTFNGAAETNGSFAFTGGAGNDALTGGGQADNFDLTKGGNDTAHGGGGNDVFTLTSKFTAADSIDGGAGSDTLSLSGDYSAGVTFGAATLTNVETLSLASGNSYKFVSNDGNLTSGQTLAVNGGALAASNTLTFDGSAETDGSFAFTGGAGTNTLTGGAGNDTFAMGATFDAGDSLNGGAGSDTVSLSGDYSAGLTLGAATLSNVETLNLAAGHSYNLTTNDANVASGQVLAVDASAFGATDALTFNGGAETNGGFLFKMGAQFGAADHLTGGAGTTSVTVGGTTQTIFASTLELNGDYAGLTLGGIVNIGTIKLDAGHNYAIASPDAIVASGKLLQVDASALASTNALTFDGSAESDGGFLIKGGAGSDALTGGAQADTFDLSQGGNDTAHGGGGNDSFALGAKLTAADTVDGGTGNDSVSLNGDYSTGVTLGASTLTSVETLSFAAGHSYNITTNDANVASGQTLTVDGSALGASDALSFNGSAETNGSFAFKMGAALVAGDSLSGGAGNDTVSLNGDYAGLTLGAATLISVETLSLAAGHNYNLTSNDGNVGAGLTLTVDASALAAANTLTFNGAAETNGSFAIIGGAGNDALTGGGLADNFDLSKGGDDTAHGGGGNDVFTLGSKFTATDTIDGGSGSDTLSLNGDYSAGVTFGAATIGAVETIQLAAGHSYNLTTNDANVAAGQTLTVDASALGASDTVTFNGAGETNGAFSFRVGANFGPSDHLTGATTTASVTVGGTTQTVFASALELNGDFAALSIGALSNIGILKADAGHNYSVTSSDATVAAGQFFEVDASALAAANGLTFNGAAETDGTFLFKGGAGNDVLSGGALADTFDLSQGGNDTAHGGNGNDIFSMGAKLNAADTIDGGTGTDTLALSGDYSAGVTLGAATLTAIESVLFAAGSSYNLTTNDGNVASGQTLTVDASALAAANALIFDGSAESDGSFAFTGGAGNDVLSGGALGDTFNLSKGGADTVHGNGGNDRISVTSQASFAASSLDGGTGNDTVTLTGDYGTLTTLTATSLTGIETLKLATTGNNYNFKMDDGNVAAGKELTVDATALANADKLTFNGGAESDGGYVFEFAGNYSTASDHLTGGTHIGSYVLNPGATVSAFDATIDLTGDYSAGLTFGAGSLTRIGAIRLHDSGHSTSVTFNGLSFAANQAMIVDASSFTANDALTFDASAETHGFFYVAGGAGDDVLTGGGDGTYFDVSQGGFDTITGTAGNDFIYGGNSALGGEYNGGAGTDTLILQGDYQSNFGLEVAGDGFPSIEIIQMLQSGFDYNVHMFDTALPAGATLTFDASNLTTNALLFDGSDEKDGFLHVIGGAGNDTITGGGQADTIDISKGGNDTVDGKGGDDIILAGAAFTAADHIVGNGNDNDTVVLDGDYSAGLVMAAHTIANVGVISCEGNFAYNITINDANMSGSNILKIEAFDSSQFTVDASAETTAFIDMYGGPGNDVMTGGVSSNFFDFTEGGHDTATGNGGRDLYECSTTAHDLMIFNAVSDSTGLNQQDQIIALNFALDTLQVSAIGAVTGVDAKVNGGVLNDNNNFDTNLSAAIGAGQLAAHHAVIFAPNSGTFSGHTFLIIDENGTAGYQSGGDLVMEISGFTGTMTVSDFT